MTTEKIYTTELIDDIISSCPDNTNITYEIWAIGYDKCGDITDAAILLGDFDDIDTAVAYAKEVSLEVIKEVNETDEISDISDVEYFSVEVETVIEDPDDPDSTINAGTVYSRVIFNEEETPIVALAAGDYILIKEDDSLNVVKGALRDFNKNDRVMFYFLDKPDADFNTYKADFNTYKIVSLVADGVLGDYYRCILD